MGKVVDIFSARPLSELDSREVPAADTIEGLGEFQGTIPKSLATEIIELGKTISAKSSIINSAVSEYDELVRQYVEICAIGDSYLDMNEKAKEELQSHAKAIYVTEEGNIWLVKKDNVKKFASILEAQSNPQ